ncbi:hypothetical protein [Ralstonia pseudosolanacearum]|uniref:hypothetical protein n=1 Tax=Ralstonia pseudosolanacearum TaxID=1310165 RepID=UPI003CF700B4
MKLSLNRYQNVSAPMFLVVPGVSILLLALSAAVFAFSMSHLRSARYGEEFWKSKAPTLSVSTTPLSEDLYKSFALEMVKRPNVTIIPRNDRIVVQGTTIADLQSWKDSVTDLMILHPELSVKSVCAGSSVCQGAALTAELSGARTAVAVSK